MGTCFAGGVRSCRRVRPGRVGFGAAALVHAVFVCGLAERSNVTRGTTRPGYEILL